MNGAAMRVLSSVGLPLMLFLGLRSMRTSPFQKVGRWRFQENTKHRCEVRIVPDVRQSFANWQQSTMIEFSVCVCVEDWDFAKLNSTSPLLHEGAPAYVIVCLHRPQQRSS